MTKNKKQLERSRMKWLVKAHIELLRGWYSEIYGEGLDEDRYSKMDDDLIQEQIKSFKKSNI